jgi:hypothetical protein
LAQLADEAAQILSVMTTRWIPQLGSQPAPDRASARSTGRVHARAPLQSGSSMSACPTRTARDRRVGAANERGADHRAIRPRPRGGAGQGHGDNPGGGVERPLSPPLKSCLRKLLASAN